jgi:farnesyl diphosphate synthase
MIHAYSLVHDDLPCMDDDDLRRGRPTCHVVYGEALAVLVGDGLQALAFEWLARAPAPRASELVRVLALGSGVVGMVGGQALDLASSADEAGATDVARIHRLKTAALIASAVELGVVAAGRVDPGDRARRDMRAYGEALGLLFQALDDLLDVTGDAGTLGKTPGKDEAGGKATLVAALGLEGARADAGRLAASARSLAMAAGCRPGDLALEMVDAVLTRRR